MRKRASSSAPGLVALILGGLAAGCGWERTTAPGSREPDWNLVRYEEGTEGQDAYRDLKIQPTGDLTLLDGWGNAAFSRGLLAGEKLETLARLTDALPPHSYAPADPLPDDGFVVTVERSDRVLTYASWPSDPGAPPEVQEVGAFLRFIGLEAGEPRTRPVSFRVLDQGIETSIQDARRVVIRDPDALVQLLRKHQSEKPAAIPSVDFSRQMVLGEFLGPMEPGTWITVDGVEVTDDGFLRVQFRRIVPDSACPSEPGVVYPYVLVAMDSQLSDFLFATETSWSQCL